MLQVTNELLFLHSFFKREKAGPIAQLVRAPDS